jgi:diguanylate cyclase (GGDEF)-like protein
MLREHEHARSEKMKSARWSGHSRYTSVILTAIVGTLLTIGAFLLVCTWQYGIAIDDFQSKAKGCLASVNADLSAAATMMDTVAAFIASTDHPVSANEFARFSAAVHEQVPGLRNIAWAPRITLEERPAFERAARAAGMADYEILQFGPHLSLTRATPRAEYYPLIYVEAQGGNRNLLGLDVISETLRAAAARRAMRTGQPAATPPIDVPSIKQPGAGVLSYMPVDSSRSGNGGGVRSVQGLVLGVFDIPEIVGTIVAKNAAAHGLNVDLFNQAIRSSRRRIYQSSAPAAAERQPALTALLAGAHWQGTILLIDQPIGAIVTPVKPLNFARWTVIGITTLLVGFAMTAMSVRQLLLAVQRTRQLESLTTNLQATTLMLHANNERITQISRHDPLTGMPNRVLLRERMDQAIARLRRGDPFGLLFLDLDHFKDVNDTLGHGAGDTLLCAVAERIMSCVRDVDTAARLGGDEFAILLADVPDQRTIATTAKRLIDSISKPYAIDTAPVVIGVSIGAAIATSEASADTLTAQADLAMYEAKNAGRGTFRLFENRLQTSVDEKQLLERDLRQGLACNELQVYYQPIVDLAENRVSCFEAFLHWSHPGRGVVPPDQFIPVAEECGLIERLGAWVLRTACADAAGWPQPIKVAVKISALQFKDATLLNTILRCLKTSGLPPDRLQIEITGAALRKHSERALPLLRQARKLGVGVAFDDLGIGYSSLTSLLIFPFDRLKIDRSLIAQIQASASAAAIVRAVIGLGTSLNVTTTAEGIETIEQLDLVRSYGCNEAQGYLFAHAQPNAQVPDLLRTLLARFPPKDHPEAKVGDAVEGVAGVDPFALEGRVVEQNNVATRIG